jgi:hypothetical protein
MWKKSNQNKKTILGTITCPTNEMLLVYSEQDMYISICQKLQSAGEKKSQKI